MNATLSSPKRDELLKSMKEEESMRIKQSLDLVDLLKEHKAIGNK